MVSNVVMTEFTSSAVVVYVVQRLKKASWFPLLREGQAWISRAFSIGAAALVAIGVNYQWNVDPATGTHTLIITGLSFTAVAVGFWHWLNQYALQETIYQATANKPGVTTDAAGSVPARVAPGGAIVVPKETP